MLIGSLIEVGTHTPGISHASSECILTYTKYRHGWNQIGYSIIALVFSAEQVKPVD